MRILRGIIMTTKNINDLTHGTVVHDLKRRVRIISPVLKKDLERAYVLEILLKNDWVF